MGKDMKGAPADKSTPFRLERAKPNASGSTTPVGFLVTSMLAVSVAACSTVEKEVATAKVDPKYGVVASPRVVKQGKEVPKGGGRYMVGKPYTIAGKRYYPRENPNYKNTGMASWYGDAFHGRQTANGEIFDMNRLTAAHTTMPLPSYARVTNVKNGRSVIVRVNDRGPFHGNRVIDLSRRTADLLDFRSDGVAKVNVEYVGRARLDGEDEEFLMASYRGPGAVTPGGTYPGTQIAGLERRDRESAAGLNRQAQEAQQPTVLAAFTPAPNPAQVDRSPQGRQERSEPNLETEAAPIQVASRTPASLDEELLGYAGYGSGSFGKALQTHTLYTSDGISVVPDPSTSVRTDPITTGARPLNLPSADVLGYRPSYSAESRIDRAFTAIGTLMSDTR